MGCTDGTSQSLSVNLYKDNTCTTQDKNEDGYDDTIIDVSSLQPSFGQCTSCVHFVDKNEDDVDDGYFEARTKNAPLCENAWEYKDSCGSKCKKMGNVKVKNGWNASDKLLLFVLGTFSEYIGIWDMQLLDLIRNESNYQSRRPPYFKEICSNYCHS